MNHTICREFDELSSKGEKVGEQLREINIQSAAAQSNQDTSCAEIEEGDLELSGSTDHMVANDDRGSEEKNDRKVNSEPNCV